MHVKTTGKAIGLSINSLCPTIIGD